jgi:alkylated DNA repair protein alkB family protein 6
MDPPLAAASPSSPSFVLPAFLEESRVQSLPASAFYIPNFINEEEEKILLDRISSAPKPKWKQLTHRRLQTWPSDLAKDTLIAGPLPPWLEEPVVSRLLSVPVAETDPDTNIFSSSPHRRPNHVLINEYPPGVGIMPHKVGGGLVWFGSG